METSILTSTKKILGIAPEYTAFDLDILTHINATFSKLYNLGVGPSVGFTIEDETSNWEEFIADNNPLLNLVKTYVYRNVQLLFDPPTTSFHLAAVKEQIQEYEWRLNEMREERLPWTAPLQVLP